MTKTALFRGPAAALLFSAAMAVALSGCVGAAIGAGAAVGVAAAQEGGIRNAASDTAIRLQITDLWLKHDVNMYRRLDMTVKEGRVLITGTVPTPDARVDAIRLAWQADGVREVINEINVDKSSGIAGYATDVWISGQLKSKLLLDKYVQSINYTVDTVNGTIYLMGIAQDQKELDRVINHARSIGRVRNVVSYVRLRGETPPGLQTPTGVPAPAAAPARAGAAGRPAAEEMTDVNGTGWTSTTPTSSIQPGPADRSVTSENLLPP
jgi:osmotically-inducible protein OsmY